MSLPVKESDWKPLIPLIREMSIDYTKGTLVFYNIRISIPDTMKLDVEMIKAQFHDAYYTIDPDQGKMITGTFKNSSVGQYVYDMFIIR
jgi:hypothetical protein